MSRGYYEADDRTNTLPKIRTGAHYPVECRIIRTPGRITPAHRLSVFIGKKALDLALCDEARGGAAALVFSLGGRNDRANNNSRTNRDCPQTPCCRRMTGSRLPERGLVPGRSGRSCCNLTIAIPPFEVAHV